VPTHRSRLGTTLAGSLRLGSARHAAPRGRWALWAFDSSSEAPAPTEPHTLSLHDALPTSPASCWPSPGSRTASCSSWMKKTRPRSEEHTSELQSRENLVWRLLLEKKKRHRGVRAPGRLQAAEQGAPGR